MARQHATDEQFRVVADVHLPESLKHGRTWPAQEMSYVLGPYPAMGTAKALLTSIRRTWESQGATVDAHIEVGTVTWEPTS